MKPLDVTRKFSNRLTLDSNLRLDMGERAVNFDSEDFIVFLSSLTQEDFICYPSESDYNTLKQNIGKLNHITPDCISFNFGSDQVIKSVFELCSTPKGSVVFNRPAFPMYQVYSDMFYREARHVEYSKDLNFSIDDFLEKLTQGVRLAILANPNSPFGDTKSIDEISFLCSALQKQKAYLLIDEAYIDFGGQSCVKLISEHKNLFVCKTFSKAWGGAGARCGYLISSPLNIIQAEKTRPSFPLSGATLKYINFLISRPHLKDDYVSTILTEKKLLQRKKLHQFDIRYGNVSWIHINDEQDNFFLDKLLSQHKISYKNGLSLPYDKRTNWIRLGLTEGISNLISK